ncbi:MAG: HD-GYP domain-containing protein [Phycisphaerales bacterium]|nr:HD-GYP domain-containing protein [Phycisphaerales bacterium]
MKLQTDIIQALVRTIELKDRTTAAHTWRVVLYTRALAEVFGLDHETISRLSVAAALHDLGKIDVPDHILQKPGKLTPEEYEIMKTHTVLGHERLVSMGEDDPLVLELVRHHHERVDGQGYPDRLVDAQIPQAAKMFAVVDTFDALTSNRPYRHEVGEAAARSAAEALGLDRGTHFAPECVDAFAEQLASGNLNWILENFSDLSELPTFDCPTKAEQMAKLLRAK